MSAVKILKPEYYDKFACAMAECEANCCAQGWIISVDEETYNKYMNVKDPILAERLRKSIERTGADKTNKFSYAKLVLDENGRCIFQTSSGLCEIHRDIGEKFLCKTCRTYPRLAKTMGENFTELSLSMSCPEAVRTALLGSTPMEFTADMMSFDSDEPLLTNIPCPTESKEKTQYLQYGWEMREAAITIMQIRTIPVAYRIIIIASMLDEITQLFDEGRADEIPALLENYGSSTYGDEFVQSFKDVEANDVIGLQMYTSLYYTIWESAIVMQNSIFAQLTKQFDIQDGTIGTNPDDAMNAAGFYAYIKEKISAHRDEFSEKWEHVLENYLVNYIFSELFPLKYHHQGLNPFYHAFLLAEQYALLQMMLCGNYDTVEGFSEQYVVRTFSQVAVLNQHTSKPLKIIEDFKALGIATPAHLYYLLFV